jgi:hypothetical protein
MEKRAIFRDFLFLERNPVDDGLNCQTLLYKTMVIQSFTCYQRKHYRYDYKAISLQLDTRDPHNIKPFSPFLAKQFNFFKSFFQAKLEIKIHKTHHPSMEEKKPREVI